jgi:hypothetical protein
VIGIVPNPDILCRSRFGQSFYNRPITNISGLFPISTVRTLKATVIYKISICVMKVKQNTNEFLCIYLIWPLVIFVLWVGLSKELLTFVDEAGLDRMKMHSQ